MFRGFSNLALDAKGRLSLPARYREQVASVCENCLVVTVNPWDQCLWLYPTQEWEAAEAKLMGLSDSDKWDRRTKQILRGYATDCQLDGQGRLLIPPELREFAQLDREVAFLGQGNRFEIWNKATWEVRRGEWFDQVERPGSELSGRLRELSL